MGWNNLEVDMLDCQLRCWGQWGAHLCKKFVLRLASSLPSILTQLYVHGPFTVNGKIRQ